jgi:hypothetical protein
MYKENVDYKNHKWYIVQTLLNGNLVFHFLEFCLVEVMISFAGSVYDRALSLLTKKNMPVICDPAFDCQNLNSITSLHYLIPAYINLAFLPLNYLC